VVEVEEEEAVGVEAPEEVEREKMEEPSIFRIV
jgi:hypothetical protein